MPIYQATYVVKDFYVHASFIKVDFANMSLAFNTSCVFAQACQVFVGLSHSIHYCPTATARWTIFLWSDFPFLKVT